MVAHELDAGRAERREERKVATRRLVAHMPPRSVELEEARRVLDGAHRRLEPGTVLLRAAPRVLPERDELAVDVVRGALCAVAETHF